VACHICAHGPGLRNILFVPIPGGALLPVRHVGARRIRMSSSMPASSLMTDDSGRVTSVEVTWLYDELYTLILLQDYALDPISTAR
jgi:hypothetical protein